MEYEAWSDGAMVGFRCIDKNGKVESIYLNPSSSDSEGQPNVFVYQGASGNPMDDSAVAYFNVGEIEN